MSVADRLLAVDVGNSRVKFGLFEAPLTGPAPLLPEPQDTFDWCCLETDARPTGKLLAWLEACQASRAVVATVHRGAAEATEGVLRDCGVQQVTRLSGTRLPVEVRVDQPERVGIDRLLAAVAANRLRRDDRAAIVIDVGTAITIDLVASDGGFEGGAILPGIRMASRAMHQETDALPDVAMHHLDDSPDAVGKSTEAALRAGLFWGAVGAIREIVARQRDRLTEPPQLLLTGGAAPSVARLLAGPDCTGRYFPHLVLAGVAIAAESPPEQTP